MYRFLGLSVLVVVFVGCSNFKITPEICNDLSTQRDAVMPSECRVYLEEKADKAFNKVTESKKISDKDVLQYSK